MTRLMNGVSSSPSMAVGRLGARLFVDQRVEHDDVAARVAVEAWRQLVDQHVLVLLEGGAHALLLHLVRLRDERLDDPEDDDGQDEGFGNLDETAERTTAHSLRSVATVPVSNL